jgi:hypothetical protein
MWGAEARAALLTPFRGSEPCTPTKSRMDDLLMIGNVAQTLREWIADLASNRADWNEQIAVLRAGIRTTWGDVDEWIGRLGNICKHKRQGYTFVHHWLAGTWGTRGRANRGNQAPTQITTLYSALPDEQWSNLKPGLVKWLEQLQAVAAQPASDAGATSTLLTPHEPGQVLLSSGGASGGSGGASSSTSALVPARLSIAGGKRRLEPTMVTAVVAQPPVPMRRDQRYKKLFKLMRRADEQAMPDEVKKVDRMKWYEKGRWDEQDVPRVKRLNREIESLLNAQDLEMRSPGWRKLTELLKTQTLQQYRAQINARREEAHALSKSAREMFKHTGRVAKLAFSTQPDALLDQKQIVLGSEAYPLRITGPEGETGEEEGGRDQDDEGEGEEGEEEEGDEDETSGEEDDDFVNEAKHEEQDEAEEEDETGGQGEEGEEQERAGEEGEEEEDSDEWAGFISEQNSEGTVHSSSSSQSGDSK